MIRKIKKERVVGMVSMISFYLTVKSVYGVFWEKLFAVKEAKRKHEASCLMACMFVIKYKRMCNLKLVHRSMYGNEKHCPKDVEEQMIG